MPIARLRPGIVALLLSVSLACGHARQSQAESQSAALEAGATPQPAPPAPAPEARSAPEPGPIGQEPQKRIRTGTLSLEVDSVDEANGAMTRITQSAGGYVADTQTTWHPGDYRTGRVVLRIPAEKYDAVERSLRALGKVLSEQSTFVDVTRAYADLETRLKVKREALARIRDLMTKRTGSLEDVLEAEREIARITEEIELAEGERRLLEHQVRLSTLTVELQEPEPMDLGRPGAWSALGDVFRNASSTVAASLAALVGFLLVALPWIAAGYGGFRLVRWMLRKRKAGNSEKTS